MAKGSEAPQLWYSGVPRNIRSPSLFGFSVLIVAILGFGVWGGTAPIDGAVVASGAFEATGENKIIQHLEGGIIQDILVREGDLVEAGQTMIRLDETGPNAQLRRLILRYSRLKAMEARLLAEAQSKDEVKFPEKLLAATSDADVMEIIASERLTFQARRDKLTSEIAVLNKGIAAFDERLSGARSQLGSIGEQLTYIAEELEGKQTLYDKELIRKPELLALQRTKARLGGEAGRLRAEIGDIKERTARAEQQITRTKFLHIEKAVDELQEVQSELQDVKERIREARNILDRVEITAPVRGVVVKLIYNTAGGVIEPGRDILELLPVGNELIIEANVRPQDIDNVRQGQEAYIRLTALNQRTTPTIPGQVIYVSADTLPDETTGRLSREDIYVARIRLDAEKAAAVDGFNPTPGMPTEVYIKTGERTFFKYLTKPILDSMARAFRES